MVLACMVALEFAMAPVSTTAWWGAPTDAAAR